MHSTFAERKRCTGVIKILKSAVNLSHCTCAGYSHLYCAVKWLVDLCSGTQRSMVHRHAERARQRVKRSQPTYLCGKTAVGIPAQTCLRNAKTRRFAPGSEAVQTVDSCPLHLQCVYRTSFFYTCEVCKRNSAHFVSNDTPLSLSKEGPISYRHLLSLLQRKGAGGGG